MGGPPLALEAVAPNAGVAVAVVAPVLPLPGVDAAATDPDTGADAELDSHARMPDCGGAGTDADNRGAGVPGAPPRRGSNRRVEAGAGGAVRVVVWVVVWVVGAMEWSRRTEKGMAVQATHTCSAPSRSNSGVSKESGAARYASWRVCTVG